MTQTTIFESELRYVGFREIVSRLAVICDEVSILVSDRRLGAEAHTKWENEKGSRIDFELTGRPDLPGHMEVLSGPAFA